MARKLYYNYGDLDYLKVVLLVEWLEVPPNFFIRINGKWTLNRIMCLKNPLPLGRPERPVPSLKDHTVSYSLKRCHLL